MRVQMLGHAGLLCETADARILMDPWIAGPSNFRAWWHLPEFTLDPATLTGIDYVYLSHQHGDHFHEPTLTRLPSRPTVLIPRLYHGRMVDRLARLGFHDVRELRHGRETPLRGSTRVTCVHTGGDSVLAVADAAASMLNVNDALQGGYPDITLPMLKALAARRPFDIAFLAFGTAGPFPKCYSFEDPSEAMRPETKERAMLNNFLAGVRAAGANAVVPFAGGFALLAKRLMWMNAVKSTPQDALDLLRQRDPAMPAFEMNHGDVWDHRGGLTRVHPGVDWSRRLEIIDAMHAQHAAELERIDAEDRRGPADLIARLAGHVERNLRSARRLGRKMDGRILLEVEGEPGGAWEVDTARRSSPLRPGDSGDWHLRFRVPAGLLGEVLDDPEGWATLAISYKLDLFFRKGARRYEGSLDRMMNTPAPSALVRTALSPRFADFLIGRRQEFMRTLRAKVGSDS